MTTMFRCEIDEIDEIGELDEIGESGEMGKRLTLTVVHDAHAQGRSFAYHIDELISSRFPPPAGCAQQ